MAEYKKVTPYGKEDESKKSQVTSMFNKIAPFYDFLNRLLTLRIDVLWRKKAIKQLKKDNPKQILDIATGTADMTIMASKILDADRYVGMDISSEMLRVGQKKIDKKNLSDLITLELGDSENGSCMILEFSKPTIFPLKQLFNIYFKYILPVVGKITSKDPKAYEYLYESVQVFPDYDNFTSILKKVGFSETSYKPLSFGICTIYLAKK